RSARWRRVSGPRGRLGTALWASALPARRLETQPIRIQCLAPSPSARPPRNGTGYLEAVTGQVTLEQAIEPSHRQKPDVVATRREEALEIGRRDDVRPGIDVGVEREARRGLKVAVDHDPDGVRGVVDESEGRNRSRRDAEVRHEA